jgi:hypothetical protein
LEQGHRRAEAEAQSPALEQELDHLPEQLQGQVQASPLAE